MCPQYTDAPALSTSINCANHAKSAYVNAGASMYFGHISS